MKLMICYDGSEVADAALEDLKRAGLPSDAEALVVTVADVLLVPEGYAPDASLVAEYAELVRGHIEHGKRRTGEAAQYAERGVEKVKRLFPGWRVRSEVLADSPAWGIVKRAETYQPHMIIIGSHGRGLIGRALFGSVSQKVLSHAQCDVRIARRGSGDVSAPPRLVVGLDGSEPSQGALEVALSRKWPKGTAMHLVTAVDARIATAIAFPDAALECWVDRKDRDPLSWAERMLRSSAQRVSAAGIAVTTYLKEGDAGTTLVKEAEKWGADGIFIGSRGLGGGERLILGSVSYAVAARAHCSVEVVRSLCRVAR
ncbi:MAG: hypothetical protein MOGMAGMI_00044 [Candidatus Omnitrophica bacterium]|nr:hypothetical protein [Candidatus Omnitrophota bacterium]